MNDTRTVRTIAIVGAGPRGLAVLERLLVRLDGGTGRTRILVLDPFPPGAGRIWRTDQDEVFTMNTVTGQVTMFSGPSGGGPDRPGAGPSLAAWLTRQPEPELATLGPDDYAPRAVYGRYLRDTYRTLVASAPDGVEVLHLAATTTRLHAAAGTYRLELDGGREQVRADAVVLCTGHPRLRPTETDDGFARFADRHPGLRYLNADSAADLPLAELRPRDVVGLLGLGLACYDIVLALTAGRGGRFERDPGGVLRYLPSGTEPKLVAGSRSGLPFPARGRNEKAVEHRLSAVFATPAAIAEARGRALRERGTVQLDFRTEVLPLLELELEHAYLAAHVRQRHGLAREREFRARHRECVADGRGTTALRAAFGLSDVDEMELERLARPFHGLRFDGQDEFREALLKLLDDDLAEARGGNVTNPLKAALDTLRDVRGCVRAAVDFGGLRPASHRDDFAAWFTPVNSLLAAGPPDFRVEQFLALLRAGMITVAGPDARFAVDEDAGAFVVQSPSVRGSRHELSVLIDARIPVPDLRRDLSPLLAGLLEDGLAGEFVAVDDLTGERLETGGLRVTPPPCRLVDLAGLPVTGLYALGLPTEHTRWFTQVGSSRPGPRDGFFADADAIAAAITWVPAQVRLTTTSTTAVASGVR
ncbi:FAD/NAD(P)-binding protein [Amycolatopsis sp. H20-H5]|uniref:FAD/NAD(P)-binding protein n=1 Tax=Amycolatopsis sp. H20-H5 TaxID=3046309 RepID=UPI002DC02CA6|nr:FAD/NAD(P)-binding protein [Amycolatopsis sp. H20-H5]MEC3978517.1 FAD/NAD(P)-binding protein [Amycolatopsis sp. H20-H5]